LLPAPVGRLLERLRRAIDGTVSTRLALTAPASAPPATPAQPRPGFTDAEQAQRVEGFLRTIGLIRGFAPLVVIMGHGSFSRNNPHLAAYDCGACSGRHGGPNARVFATMANRPEVRALLRQRGLDIPDDTWFLGAQHNTCDEGLLWFDTEAMPAAFREPLATLGKALEEARTLSAHERCRRLASAPRFPTLAEALSHMEGRASDPSQARPELGHATNAVAFIGRRAATRGLFLDRRIFLISYDPSTDPRGAIVETILVNAGPVGAGISLEYYFSTVNNDGYGCGTKIVHNVVGGFGVMEGTSSDLRTGLPRQMIEIHEAMRLLVVVEHRPEILSGICERQPIVMELVAKGWIQLAAMDPDSAELHVYCTGTGWQPWQPDAEPVPQVDWSPDWYRGHTGPLPPALVTGREGDANG
ncbi:MAG: DUF2309 family protein, partial [Magnetococcales bacterium]|nr:DUF2309 family protein [Magnetococcales bacterium]